jgi:hypothetical protein
MVEMLYQLWVAVCILFLLGVVLPAVVYIVMKVGTFAVLMGRKSFYEYLIKKEEERHGDTR